MKTSKDKKYCTASLVLGIVGFVLAFAAGIGFIPCVTSIILSLICFASKYKGKAKAIVGMIMSMVGVIICPFALMAALGTTALATLFGATATLQNTNDSFREEDQERTTETTNYYGNVEIYIPADTKYVGADSDGFVYRSKDCDYCLPKEVYSCDDEINADNFKENAQSILRAEPDSDTCVYSLESTKYGEVGSWDCGTVEFVNNQNEPTVAVMAYSKDGSKLLVLLAHPGQLDDYSATKQELLDIVEKCRVLYS